MGSWWGLFDRDFYCWTANCYRRLCSDFPVIMTDNHAPTCTKGSPNPWLHDWSLLVGLFHGIIKSLYRLMRTIRGSSSCPTLLRVEQEKKKNFSGSRSKTLLLDDFWNSKKMGLVQKCWKEWQLSTWQHQQQPNWFLLSYAIMRVARSSSTFHHH